MKKKIILWTLCILWMILIFMFSHQNAELSSDVSQGFTARIIMFLAEYNIIDIPVSSLGLSEAVLKIAESIDTVVRKLAHFSIFGILGILVYELSLCYYKTKKAKANTYPEGKKHTKMLLFLYRYTYIDNIGI